MLSKTLVGKLLVQRSQRYNYLVLFPDPNNPSADRFQYLAQGRRVWGFDQDLRLECRHTRLLVNYHILL